MSAEGSSYDCLLMLHPGPECLLVFPGGGVVDSENVAVATENGRFNEL